MLTTNIHACNGEGWRATKEAGTKRFNAVLHRRDRVGVDVVQAAVGGIEAICRGAGGAGIEFARGSKRCSRGISRAWFGRTVSET